MSLKVILSQKGFPAKAYRSTVHSRLLSIY